MQKIPEDETEGVFDDENVNSFLSEPDDSDEDVGLMNFENENYPLEPEDESDDEPASW